MADLSFCSLHNYGSNTPFLTKHCLITPNKALFFLQKKHIYIFLISPPKTFIVVLIRSAFVRHMFLRRNKKNIYWIHPPFLFLISPTKTLIYCGTH